MHTELQPYIAQPRDSDAEKLRGQCRRTHLSTQNRLLLILIWLREYCAYSVLEAEFGVDKVYISREIHHIIPIICWRFQHEILWPSAEQCKLLEGTFPDVTDKTFFAMDFTTQPISEPAKPIEHRYYCGDKHKHFLNSLGAIDVSGLFLHFEPGFNGHANDQRSFVLSALGCGQLEMDDGQTGIADGGFSANDKRILTPYHGNQGGQCSSWQLKANRCGVENAWHNFKTAYASQRLKFHHSRFFQPITARAAALIFNRLSRQQLQNSLNIFREAERDYFAKRARIEGQDATQPTNDHDDHTNNKEAE